MPRIYGAPRNPLDDEDYLSLVLGTSAQRDELKVLVRELRAALEAMRAAAYEQPIGAWFGSIDATLAKSTQPRNNT
jgi:hypothetical protein